MSVIIGDLDIACASFIPNETNAPLIVDPDAMLPFAIPFQGFQAIVLRVLPAPFGRDTGHRPFDDLQERLLHPLARYVSIW